MATLRDRLINAQAPDLRAYAPEQQMGEFGRGLRSALIGADANQALAEEASLRAAGNLAEADRRRALVNTLRQQQSLAPTRMNEVESITGVGDAADWAAGVVGNAAGSMAAPVAAGAGTALAGSALQLAPSPTARAVGRLLRGPGAFAAPFAINQQQMKGEFYGQASADPEIMARTSPQELNRIAEGVGLAGGALDAVLPGMVGRSVAGAGLRSGGVLSKFLGGSLMEGGTELGQGEISRQTRLGLNPAMDTSGFDSDRLNDFAAGAVGGAPFSAAGAAADAGYGLARDTTRRAGELAGTTIDLASEKAGEAVSAARAKMGDKVDLDGLKTRFKEAGQAAKSRWDQRQEELDLLNMVPPADLNMDDDAAVGAWSDRRDQFISDKLNELAEQGDAQAAAMLQQGVSADDAAPFLADRMRLGAASRAAERFGEVAGDAARKAGRAAKEIGQAAWQGATRKKNAQVRGQSRPLGALMEAMTEGEQARYDAAKAKGIPELMRRTGDELTELIAADADLQDGALLRLDRMANNMVAAYGPQRAVEVSRELGNMVEPKGKKLVGELAKRVEMAVSPQGGRETLTLRRKAADKLLAALPADREEALLAEGINLRTDEGKRQLLGMVESISAGLATPQARRALESLVGEDAVVDMVQAIAPVAPDTGAEAPMFEGSMDERLSEMGLEATDEGEVVDSYERRGAEKNVAKGSGPTYYGFAKRPTMGNSQEARDPFGYTERLTKTQMRQRIASGKPLPRRPTLFKPEDQLSDGTSAIDGRVASMQRQLGDSRFKIEPRQVNEVMDELGLEPMKRIQLFRDYMSQEAQDAEGEVAQRYREASKLARAYLLDIVDGVEGGERKVEQFRTTPKDRAFVRRQMERYFNSRFMVTAEPMTDADPDEMTPAAIKKLAERGRVAYDESRKPNVNAEEMADADNLLTFVPTEGKAEALYVKAADLAKWARDRRLASTEGDLTKTDTSSEGDRDREFVRDLMTGVAAMVSTGMVKGLPKRGVQSFANGVPDGLILPSGRRYADLKGTGKKVKGTTTDEAVAAEQERDFFTPDESMADEATYKAERDEATAKRLAQVRKDRGEKKLVRQMVNEERKERLTSGESRKGELDSDYEAQRYISNTQGFNATTGRRRGDAKVEATAPDLSTPRKFMTALQTFADAVNNVVQGKPDVQGDFGVNSKRQTEGVLAARRKEFDQYTEALAEHLPQLTDKQRALVTKLTTEIGNNLGLNASPMEGGAQVGKSQSAPAGAPRRKLNAQATEIHNDLKRGGFAATHDSPHRFDGRFNWRASKRTGEGQMVFGAGTYLSTGDKVHSFYKKQFTNKAQATPLSDEARAKMQEKLARYKDNPDAAELRQALEEELARDERVRRTFAADTSPTYQVSVQIMPSQLMNWDKPLSQQSGRVQRVLRKAVDEFKIRPISRRANLKGEIVVYEQPVDEMTGEAFYKELAGHLGSMEKASEWLQANGVLGHEYAASNGRNGRTPNYVIYDDSKIVTNYVHFNQQSGGSPPSTAEEQQAAKDYVKRVLGPKVKVEFQNITGYSGEWVDADQTIYISTTAAPGAMQTAYHEALHGFFSKFVQNNPEVLETMKALSDHKPTLERVMALLDGYPAAQKQLVDGEERLAYIYQFWAAGLLDLPQGKPRTLMQKVRRFFQRVLGMIGDDQRAAAILEAFHRGDLSGEPSAAGQVIAKAMAEGTWTRKNLRKMDALMQRAAALTMPAESILGTSSSETAQKLGKLLFTNPADAEAGKEEPGYINARDQMGRRYTNEFSRIVDGLTERDYKDVARYMTEGTDVSAIPYKPHAEAVGKLRALLRRFRTYMVDERGMKVGDLGPNYFPRVWSADRLIEKRDAFMKMMAAKYPERNAEAVYNALIENQADDLRAGRPTNEEGVLTPLNVSGEERVFAWMDGTDAQPFLEDNLVGIMTRYFHQGARAAEYTHRFGQNGARLEKMLSTIDKELRETSQRMLRKNELADKEAADKWHARQMRDIKQAVGAMEGTLGKDINPVWRSTNSWVTVYQNIRLLPLSLFSSVVDPLGLVVRGAEFREAYDAFIRGMQEVGRTWSDLFRSEPKERQADKWQRLAEYVGSVDAAVFDTQLSDMYASVYMNPTAKRWNDTYFKLNGMEGWNRGMRVGATRAAVKFIERHSKLPDSEHSARWLQELGLEPGDIDLDADGNLLVTVGEIEQAKGITREAARARAAKIHNALNRWVTGAVLTPNAAQRPAWSSDPHYSMFFHLKQFTYSFHQTILKRVYNEMNHGNLAPLTALFWYMPVMIASDITKGVLQGGGELPAHMKGMDAGEWVMYSLERSGITGLGQIGLDVGDDVASIGGPMVEQTIDAFSEPLERTAVNAMPAMPLYRELMR